jgi:predicted SnoaL-like aldol condensation-catalyzing enzyme
MAQPKETVMAYQRSLGDSDWIKARSYLKDDMKFHGPLAKYDEPEPYIEDLKGLHHIVKGVEMRKVFQDGNDVCLLYDMITDTAAGTAFICEWYRVDDEKISSIRVVFDARPFAPMFEGKH